MNKGRLEAFSDGVLAIIITIMVLGMRIPKGESLAVFKPLMPIFISYIVSFMYVGIYWNNHHHLFQITKKVNGKILWANHFLLFTISILPFTTGWVGENHFAELPSAIYGINLSLCAIAFNILEFVILKGEGKESLVADALQNKTKELISIILYISGVMLSFFYTTVGVICYALVATLWLIPDRRIERKLN